MLAIGPFRILCRAPERRSNSLDSQFVGFTISSGAAVNYMVTLGLLRGFCPPVTSLAGIAAGMTFNSSGQPLHCVSCVIRHPN